MLTSLGAIQWILSLYNQLRIASILVDSKEDKLPENGHKGNKAADESNAHKLNNYMCCTI